VGKLIRLLLEI